MFDYDNATLRSTWGVYAIVRKRTDWLYIGKTQNCFLVRWEKHLYELDRGKHKNSNLQSDWTVYGSQAFSFRILESYSGKPPISAWGYYREWFHQCQNRDKNLYNQTDWKDMSFSIRKIRLHCPELLNSLSLDQVGDILVYPPDPPTTPENS
jgi:hypothetical protein